MPWTVARGSEPPFAALTDAPSHRGRPDPILVEGVVPVQRAIEAGLRVRAVAASPATRARLPEPAADVPCWETDDDELAARLGYPFHRGCVAVVARPAPVAVDEAVAAWLRDAHDDAVVVVAEGLADPVNVGAIVRNARAFGVAGVVFVGGADPLSPRAVRASVGHVFAQPWSTAADAPSTLHTLQRHGVRSLAATVSPGAADITEVASGAVALWVGTEGPGLSTSTRTAIAEHVTIPIATEVDSLNVAAATAVMLHALRGRAPIR